MVGSLVQWRHPADDDVCNVVGFIRQFQNELNGVRLHQDAVHAVYQYADHPRCLSEAKIAQKHEHDHDTGVAQHKEKDGHHTLIGPTHFQGFHQRGDGNPLSRIGVTQNCRCGAPHIGGEGLTHGEEHGANQHEQQIHEGGCQNVDYLPGDPGPPFGPHQIEGRTGGQERHIRKEQHQQHRGQENGIAVTEVPDEHLHKLHGGVMLHGKGHSLVRKQEAQNEGQQEGYQNPGIPPPQAEVVSGDGK